MEKRFLYSFFGGISLYYNFKYFENEIKKEIDSTFGKIIDFYPRDFSEFYPKTTNFFIKNEFNISSKKIYLKQKNLSLHKEFNFLLEKDKLKNSSENNSKYIFLDLSIQNKNYEMVKYFINEIKDSAKIYLIIKEYESYPLIFEKLLEIISTSNIDHPSFISSLSYDYQKLKYIDFLIKNNDRKVVDKIIFIFIKENLEKNNCILIIKKLIEKINDEYFLFKIIKLLLDNELYNVDIIKISNKLFTYPPYLEYIFKNKIHFLIQNYKKNNSCYFCLN